VKRKALHVDKVKILTRLVDDLVNKGLFLMYHETPTLPCKGWKGEAKFKAVPTLFRDVKTMVTRRN
jgi:hypothetical protein